MASTIVAGNITNGGTAISSDSTGILDIKTGTGSGTTALTLDASQNVTAANNLNATGFSSVSTFGFKNRLINGAFQIAQRSIGGSVTPAAGVTTYNALDRWFIAQTGTTASLFFGQTTPQTTGVFKAGYFGRNNGQTNIPATIFLGQQIESFNVYDLRGQTVTASFNAFRGANAPATLNVVARFGTTADQASANGLNGTWTGYTAATVSALSIGTTVASYTYSFTVPSNASEMMLLFYYIPVGTAGANEWFALENVQLEKGSIATSFDFRSYGTELALCQRYYLKNTTVVDGGGTSFATASRDVVVGIKVSFPVEMRITPTLSLLGTTGRAGAVANSENISTVGFSWGRIQTGSGSAACYAFATGGFSVDSEL